MLLNFCLKNYAPKSFDYAIVSMSLHDMPRIFRLPLVKELARVAKTVIAIDYSRSMPFNFAGLRNRMIEFLAGAEHFANFREFLREGGLEALVTGANLEIESTKYVDKECVTIIQVHSK